MTSQGQKDDDSSDEGLLYGAYALRLREELLHHITVTLPAELSTFGSLQSSKDPKGYSLFIQICGRLPFITFKNVIESSDLPVPTDKERFDFAKRCIADRRKAAAALGATDFEESVVLAFGAGSGGSVQVIRKPRRRQLWKVEG